MNELKKRIKSFGYAFKGIASLIKKEHNAWIHCTAIVVVTLASPDYHPIAGDVKDVAAGAVLICAIAAAIVGMIVFIPYMFG